ncbi:MAG: hypothetical protein IKW89_00015 [Bacteroidales bacterium]|nr:hypothetical protein [Bacteroidales bacterium]
MKTIENSPESEAQKRHKATDAFAAMRADVARAGIPEMTLDEINAEIKAMRAEKRKRE